VEEPRALQDGHQTRKAKDKKGQNRKAEDKKEQNKKGQNKKGRWRNHPHSRTDKE
jgi:hypothetical protein